MELKLEINEILGLLNNENLNITCFICCLGAVPKLRQGERGPYD